jgi:Transcription factor WhiB
MSPATMRSHRPVDVAWMAGGACVTRSDLPWIADPEQCTPWERLAMAGLCQDCPVLSACARYAKREKVTAGFWAGAHRDPDAPAIPAGPRWAAQTLPGLGNPGGLGDLWDRGGLGGLGGAA